MKSWLKLCGQGLRFCGHCALSLFLWTLWLALALLLVLQVWVVGSHELAVPGFLLRAFEERLAVSHVQVKFGRALFDPSGRILVENVKLFLPAFDEPVVVNHTAYLELDPWALLAGRFEPRVLQVSGASVAIPAMLSPTGRPEDIVHDLDATLRFDEHELVIEQLTAHVAGIAVVARGAIHVAPQAGPKVRPLPLADYLAGHYPELCHQLIRVTDRLAGLDQPQLRIVLAPSETRGAIATVRVFARTLKLTAPITLQATGLRASTRFPLQGDAPVMAPLYLGVDELQLPGGVSVRDVSARLRGSLQPALYTFDPRDALLRVGQLETRGFVLTDLSAGFLADPLPRLQGEVIAECLGAPLALRGRADLAQKTATVHFEGDLAPALLQPISHAVHRDLRPFIGFGAPVQLEADLDFAPGWKFTGLTGHVDAAQIDAYHVPIDAGRADIAFDGRHFLADHAYARLGENYAYGSFAMDFATLDHRFLLQGRLRPLEISHWFGKWWPAFFENYEFPLGPPEADVDVQSFVHERRLNTVFVYAEGTGPVVHGVKFDHARTLLFIRPNFLDGQEVFATLGSGMAQGTFTRQVDADFSLIGLDLNFDATLPVDIPGRIFGPNVAEVLAPYWFAQPPAVKLAMHFDGPASPDGVHQVAQITAQSTGAFTFHDFPLSNLSFHATVHDDEVVLDRVEVGFAGGRSTGSARVWGRDAERRLGFDYFLRNASLGQAVSTVEAFSAKRQGLPPPAPGKFVQDKAKVKLDLAVSAEGLYDDPYSYRGSGNAVVTGDALGEVRLLGLLSDLLSFTSLRFTTARASFKLDGTKLEFPQVDVTGANSAIAAHGSYLLDRHELNFTARVNPFQESDFLPTALLGVVLSPFSSVLEVKLTGTLEKPAWAFVNGPTNFMRNLAKPAHPEPAKAPASPSGALR